MRVVESKNPASKAQSFSYSKRVSVPGISMLNLNLFNDEHINDELRKKPKANGKEENPIETFVGTQGEIVFQDRQTSNSRTGSQPSDQNRDPEAVIKNLACVDTPNSFLRQNKFNAETRRESMPQNISRHGRSQGDVHSGFKTPRKIISDTQFNGWRKEFGNSFKKVSVISKLRNGANFLNNSWQHQGNGIDSNIEGDNSNVEDQDDENYFTKQLASDLLNSMLAGTPAALFASTQFLYDESGKKKIPFLLAMLNIRVVPLDEKATELDVGIIVEENEAWRLDGQLNDLDLVPVTNRRQSTSRRGSVSSVASHHGSASSFLESLMEKSDHSFYRLDLEYGIGANRLKWSIIRSYKELGSLHNKLKLIMFQLNTVKKLYIDQHRFHKLRLPHFPHAKDSARRVRAAQRHHLNPLHGGDADNSRNASGSNIHTSFILSDGSHNRVNNSVNSIETSDQYSNSRLGRTETQGQSLVSTTHFEIGDIRMKHLEDLIDEQDDFGKPMHIRIERYLRLLNIALCLRPQANRLAQFYEFSPIANLLSYETGYQGKQGYLVIRSTARSSGWRVSHFSLNDWREMVKRHTAKWFLVRHSYIMYVSDISSTTPLDVFMVDHKFKIRYGAHKVNLLDEEYEDINNNLKKRRNRIKTKSKAKESKLSSKVLLITMENSERKLKVICKSDHSLIQWVHSITRMAKICAWSKPNRFGSFAPVRKNVYCKFLVDGRDYFWALSEALSMAEDVIYIHDWWLSPELYMRRPLKGNQEYRLDRILKSKAEEGVKIFIIVYRNFGSTVGTDSSWTKHSMINLHENIHIIRSPNQWLQSTYFWAHHEKMTVIDNKYAFMGGIDLCYGRYDTPNHVLRDDKEDLADQIFPGKDYSNARISDFYDLDKPYESMYDRKVYPRMPWHDCHMTTFGEPARDMARHFVQRWNYLLREKRPSRPTPLLIPPSNMTQSEIENSELFRKLKPRSTCEVQVLRSAGNWSLGLKETETSIQSAYLKLIETSEYYIYIENQFFISTSSWDGVVIENKIGDALVDRIIKANTENKPWRAFILIPLMPGFDSPVDQPEASSLRLIMQCQYQSISRGESSIFARLRKLNINPLQYIQFYSLRKWSTIGPHDELVTEQLYIHSKLLIADDRNCIIGSANINERSQLGNRDSEVAIVIRDTDMIKTRMNGKEYYAGRFAWELRQRLMREHLGCDVDLVEITERKFQRLKDLALSNYKALQTIATDTREYTEAALKESAMIELGYREVFDVNYSSRWSEVHLDNNRDTNNAHFLSKNYGILEENPNNFDTGKRNSKSNVNSFTDSGSNGPLLEFKAKKTRLPKNVSELNKKSLNDKKVFHTFNYRAGTANKGIRDKKNISYDPRLTHNPKHDDDVNGYGMDKWKDESFLGFKQSVTEQIRKWATEAMTSKAANKEKKGGKNSSKALYLPDEAEVNKYLADDTIADEKKWDMLKRICYLQHLSYKFQKDDEKLKNTASCTNTTRASSNHGRLLADDEIDDDALDVLVSQLAPDVTIHRPSSTSDILSSNFIDPYEFEDPLSTKFADDCWFAIALRNTLLFRLVFHCQPDNTVQTWKEFKDFTRMYEEFFEAQDALTNLESPDNDEAKQESTTPSTTSTLQANAKTQAHLGENAILNKGQKIGDIKIQPGSNDGLDVNYGNGPEAQLNMTNTLQGEQGNDVSMMRERKINELKMKLRGNAVNGFNQRIFDKYTARRILDRIHGHLVIFPTEWLSREVESRNWFYSADRLPPIDIYD